MRSVERRRPLVLWATPRTVSTAFARMIIERGDHVVLDEPWSRAYYFGPERRSKRFPLTFPESTYAAIEAGVLAVGADRLFVKDMAYHAVPGISDEMLSAATNTFIIRSPAAALTSLHRRWPDFTPDEAGYRAQRLLFDRVVQLTGTTPVVVDSDRLRADAPGVVAQWCEHVGLDHRPDALSWSPGMRPEWPLWRDWYEDVARSTGFVAPPRTAPERSGATVPERVAALIDEAERHLEPLADAAI